MKRKPEAVNFGTDAQLRVIVVGSSTDDFVRYTVSLLEECEVDFVLCDDVYSAVGELAKSITGNVLAIGRLGQLSREKGRFLQMAIDKGIWCCCFVDESLAQTRGYFGPGLTPREAAVFVISEPAQIRHVISKLLAEGYTSFLCKKENKVQEFIRDEFLTTQAELDVLLGS